MLETYHLINFSLGGNKKGPRGFYRRVSAQLRELRPDKRILSVAPLGCSPPPPPVLPTIKENKTVSILKLL